MAQKTVITPDGKVVPMRFPFPKDFTPVQRTAMKLYGHIAIVVFFNGALTAFALFGQSKVVSWQTVIISVIAQMVLVLLDCLKKYYSATNQLPLSTLFDLARAEVQLNVPAVSFTQNQQALQQAIADLFPDLMGQQAALHKPDVTKQATMQYPAIMPDAGVPPK